MPTVYDPSTQRPDGTPLLDPAVLELTGKRRHRPGRITRLDSLDTLARLKKERPDLYRNKGIPDGSRIREELAHRVQERRAVKVQGPHAIGEHDAVGAPERAYRTDASPEIRRQVNRIHGQAGTVSREEADPLDDLLTETFPTAEWVDERLSPRKWVTAGGEQRVRGRQGLAGTLAHLRRPRCGGPHSRADLVPLGPRSSDRLLTTT